MAEFQSESQQIEKASRRSLIPSVSEAVLYVLLGIILLTILNSSSLVRVLRTDYIGSPENLNINLSVLNDSLSTSFSTAFDGRLGQIAVWAFIGAITYIGLWFLKNVLNSFENDVIIDHYLHPSSFSRSGYWGSAMAGKIFFGVLLILVVSYTYVAIKMILPAVATLSATALFHFKFPAGILYILLSILISTAVIYFWVIMLRIISHIWRML